MERKVLGRGLSALIPEKARKSDGMTVENLKIDNIKPNRFQPREEFDSQKMDELVLSIKEKGVIQPVLVRSGDDGYELIAGERRLRAAKRLGLTEVPALIRDVEDVDMLGLALIENIQRQELNPMEEAQAYKRLVEEFNFTNERIGQIVGKDAATISNSMRLLLLPVKIQDHVAGGTLSVGHAKVLLSVEGAGTQLELSKKIIQSGMSVRALERLIKRNRMARKKENVNYDLRAVEENLKEVLGTKVLIHRGKNKGRIEIEYYSDQDLDRIVNIIKK